MKLIALRDFSNVKALKIKVPDGEKVNDRHIHKGFIFEIGTGKTVLEMRDNGEVADASNVAHLIYARAAADASDAEVVKRVNDDVAQDKKREAAALKATEEAHRNSAGAALTKLVEQLAAKAAK